MTPALAATRELGLAIPSDLALAAFDDHPYYEYFRPSITAVSQPDVLNGVSPYRRPRGSRARVAPPEPAGP